MNYSKITKRWLDVIFERTKLSVFGTNYRVFALGDSIYSYGQHFEIARVLRDAKGTPRAFLLNGERFSNSTTNHQTTVRRVIADERMPMVIIPHAALVSAGIDFDTIELVEVTQDRWEETKHRSTEMPVGAGWVEVAEHAYVDLTDAEIDAKLDRRHASLVENWEAAKARTAKYEWARDPGPRPERPTRDSLTEWDLREYRKVGSHMELQGRYGNRIQVVEQPDGTTEYRWTTSRHWLGESLIRAAVNTSERLPCPKCDGTGRKSGEFEGRWTGTRRLSDAEFARGACTRCHGRGTYRRRRWAYFLSGFDDQDNNLYFFCELPRGVKPTTVAEAYETLKPDTVKLAEQMGRKVFRQGDIFAVELRDADKRSLRKAGARFEKRGNLLGTNHVATETAYMPDGTTLVRGVLWHVPEGRRPDHRRVRLDPGWYIAIKNTVPVSL